MFSIFVLGISWWCKNLLLFDERPMMICKNVLLPTLFDISSMMRICNRSEVSSLRVWNWALPSVSPFIFQNETQCYSHHFLLLYFVILFTSENPRSKIKTFAGFLFSKIPSTVFFFIITKWRYKPVTDMNAHCNVGKLSFKIMDSSSQYGLELSMTSWLTVLRGLWNPIPTPNWGLSFSLFLH